MNLSQILAITRYELLMSWRQRAIQVMSLSLIALPIFFGFLFQYEIAKEDSFFDLINPQGEHYARSVTGTVQMFSWAAIYLILVIMAPLVMSAIIPKDRQLAVRDLLDGLPITPATYLNGKLLGGWLITFVGLVAAMPLVIISWLITFKAIYLPSIFSLWLVGGTALVILNTGLAILLTAGQPTRKRAYAISVCLVFVCLIFHVMANTNFGHVNEFVWWEFLTPARNPLYRFFVFENMANITGLAPAVPLVDSIRIWQTTLAGLAELALVWAFARIYVQTH